MFLSKTLIHFWIFPFILLFFLDFLKYQILLFSVSKNGTSEPIGRHLFQWTKCEQGSILHLRWSSKQPRRNIKLFESQQWIGKDLGVIFVWGPKYINISPRVWLQIKMNEKQPKICQPIIYTSNLYCVWCHPRLSIIFLFPLSVKIKLS